MVEAPEVIDLKEVVDDVVEGKQIVLYNDEVNTFDHVIACLMKYCRHTPLQAEQIATLVHLKGKCEAKKGEYATLKPICEALLENKLTAKIE